MHAKISLTFPQMELSDPIQNTFTSSGSRNLSTSSIYDVNKIENGNGVRDNNPTIEKTTTEGHQQVFKVARNYQAFHRPKYMLSPIS